MGVKLKIAYRREASARVRNFGADIRAGQIADEQLEPPVRDECKARISYTLSS